MNKYILRYTSKTGFAGQGSRNQYVEFAAGNRDLAEGIAMFIVSERDIEGKYDVFELTHISTVESVNSSSGARQAA